MKGCFLGVIHIYLYEGTAYRMFMFRLLSSTTRVRCVILYKRLNGASDGVLVEKINYTA